MRRKPEKDSARVDVKIDPRSSPGSTSCQPRQGTSMLAFKIAGYLNIPIQDQNPPQPPVLCDLEKKGGEEYYFRWAALSSLPMANDGGETRANQDHQTRRKSELENPFKQANFSWTWYHGKEQADLQDT
jgi:hypothetical protein